MTHTIEEQAQPDQSKSNQSLEFRVKVYFTMIWWGVEAWGLVNGYKANGYSRKYKEARRAMLTGVTIYSIGILAFILVLL